MEELEGRRSKCVCPLGVAMNDTGAIVYIVDDDPLVRDAVGNLLRSIKLDVRAFPSTEEFAAIDLEERTSCLVLDVRFVGTAASGLEFQRDLVARNVRIPIVFLSGHMDVRASVEAMKNGAVDFLLKPFREQELLDAVRLGLSQDRLRRERKAGLSDLIARFETLTPRERDLTRLIARGLLGKQIAAELGVSEVTVKVHRARIMQKLQLHSVVDLVRAVDLACGAGLDLRGTSLPGSAGRGLVKVG